MVAAYFRSNNGQIIQNGSIILFYLVFQSTVSNQKFDPARSLGSIVYGIEKNKFY